MDKTDAISLISKIRHATNLYIEKELEVYAVKGLATSHGDILYALFANKVMTMAEIAKTIGKDKSTVTPLVRKLENTGFLYKEKDTIDTRVTLVKLTDKGMSLEKGFEEISKNLVKKFYQNISEEDADTFFKVLTQIHQNIGNID